MFRGWPSNGKLDGLQNKYKPIEGILFLSLYYIFLVAAWILDVYVNNVFYDNLDGFWIEDENMTTQYTLQT